MSYHPDLINNQETSGLLELINNFQISDYITHKRNNSNFDNTYLTIADNPKFSFN